MKQRVRSSVTALVGLLLAASCALVAGAAPRAEAQVDEVQFYEASIGITRTNIRVEAIDFDPTRGLLYLATDREILSIDPSLAGTPVVVQRGSLDARLGPVLDLDVSDDGRSVFVLFEDNVVRFEADGLAPDAPIDVGSELAVVASPDRPDLFIVVTRHLGLSVFESGVETDIRLDFATGFSGVQAPVAFSPRGDTIYAFGEVRDRDDFALLELQWEGGPSIVRRGSAVPEIDESQAVVRGDELWAGTRRFDLESFSSIGTVNAPSQRDLTLLASLDAPGRPEVVFRNRSTQTISVIDPSTPEQPPIAESRFPFQADDVVSLGSGRVAVIERDSDGLRPEGYLTFADAERLASNYGEFVPHRPQRILDTREGLGAPGRPLGVNGSIELDVTTGLGVDADDVIAVVLNATVTGPTADTYVTLWPADIPKPFVSNLNVARGGELANMVTVAVGPSGRVGVFNRHGETDVVVDRVGYYVGDEGANGSRYVPVVPERIADTRENDVRVDPVSPGQTIDIAVPRDKLFFARLGADEITAVVANITAIAPTRAGFLTTWSGDGPRPLASTVNVARNETRANLAIIPTSQGGRFSIYNGAGDIDIAVDIVGLYAQSDDVQFNMSHRGRLFPTSPYRLFDSREDPVFPPPGSLRPGDALIVPNTEHSTDIVNVVVVGASRPGFVSVVGFEEGQTIDYPSTSSVNFDVGETIANSVYATGGPDNAYVNPLAELDLVIDVFGFVTPPRLRPVTEVWGP